MVPFLFVSSFWCGCDTRINFNFLSQICHHITALEPPKNVINSQRYYCEVSIESRKNFAIRLPGLDFVLRGLKSCRSGCRINSSTPHCLFHLYRSLLYIVSNKKSSFRRLITEWKNLSFWWPWSNEFHKTNKLTEWSSTLVEWKSKSSTSGG